MSDVDRRIAVGSTAERAVYDAFAAYRALLANAGEYLAGRVADLDDVRNRIVARLLGVPMPGVPDSDEPYVLIARDLAPADTALLDPRWCSVSSPRRAGRPATARSWRGRSAFRPWWRCPAPVSWPRARSSRWTAARARSSWSRPPRSAPRWRAPRPLVRRRWPLRPVPGPPRTGTRCRCSPTSAVRATCRRRSRRGRRVWGCSAPSSCSWTTASRPLPRRSRSRPTVRCWRRSPRGASSCGCWTPGRTSRWTS